MRTEYEMLDIIKSVAAADHRIKAAAICGSRADKSCPKDVYQDYDVEYYVDDVSPYHDNTQWLEKHFGKTLIVQLPELMDGTYNGRRFAYLAIFEDGVRVDLSILAAPPIDGGEPRTVLLDKCGVFEGIRSNEYYYNVTAPNEKKFKDCCNEFWWCLNNVAKGLAREQIPYVMTMYCSYVKDMLDRMLSWYIGTITDFSVSAGKCGKYFKKYLPDSVYKKYLKMYCAPETDSIWQSVISTCKLFSDIARLVAGDLGFEYNASEEEGIRTYMMNIKSGVYK